MKKLNFQRIFCFVSFLFILSCCIFYGTRFIKLYLENRKVEIEEKNSLVKVLRESNVDNENFEIVNGKNYFTGNTDVNYLEYSHILWRIINVNADNSITAISDTSLTTLAHGKNLSTKESFINKWLNITSSEYSGILEKQLNNIDTYLQKTDSCNDTYDELTNTPCKNITNDSYLTLLSIPDYLNIGGKDSYLSNHEYYYLNNTNSENKAWYIADSGKTSSSNGDDILGVRPVITIKANVDYVSGTGTKEDPYKIEKENSLFGSYVKLDNDIWRIYELNDTEIKLMLNNYIENTTHQYSSNNSYYDDYSKNSTAYYLNHTFLDSLSYKDKIKETNWSNGYYNDTDNYDYTTSLKETINSKVALMSIGNIFLNNELTNYYTMTGTKTKSLSVYTIQKSQKIYSKQISNKLNIVPTISIDKNLLTKGSGTIDSPLEME